MVITNFTPVQSAIGGALIGVSAVLLLLFSGRIAGITGVICRALLPGSKSRPLEAFSFLGGMMIVPLFWPLLTGGAVQQTVSENLPLLTIAGLLVGFGSAWGSGCTSGHGVCGLSRLSPRSIAATATFMAIAVVTVYVTRHIAGG